MRVTSVNVGMPRETVWKGLMVRTGIFKEPVAGPVMVRTLNLSGDQQADLTVHGGSAKAVYAYPAEHYPYWQGQLPEATLSPGNFGENLTTEGLLEPALCIGDRLQIGSAVLMVTQPRMPCYKLALRFQRDDMIHHFLASGRVGFYFAVVQAGEVYAGCEIKILDRDPHRVSVADIMKLYLGKVRDPDLADRAAKVSALPDNWKYQIFARMDRQQL